MTQAPFFFGYGSLVNRATHAYPDARPAVLTGWRRRWVHTEGRQWSLLTAERHAGAEIEGLVAAVPGGDWAALDLREAAYCRHDASAAVRHDLPGLPRIEVYSATAPMPPSPEHPIPLSYIDTVCTGFREVHGPEGPARFFATTEGWEVIVLDDRRAAVYPRATPSSEAERAEVDGLLGSVGARVRATV